MILAMAEQQEQALWVQVAGIKPVAFQPDASLPRSVARAKKWLKSLAVAYSMVPGVAPMIAELLGDPAVTLGQSGRHLSVVRPIYFSSAVNSLSGCLTKLGI